jgi:glycosyltransferase involved in cell wall biosynthesis
MLFGDHQLIQGEGFMKIVYCLAQCNDPSGGIRIIFEQANRLLSRGHEVEIWTLDPFLGILPFPVKAKIKHVPNEYDFTKHKVISLRLDEDATLTTDIFVAGSYPAIFGYTSVPRAKPFWYLQGDEAVAFKDNKEMLNTYFEALKLPVNFLCNSAWTKETLAVKYKKEAEIITCGIDNSLFYHEKSPELAELFPSLVFVYDNQRCKGIDDMFITIRQLKKIIPELHLFVISKYQLSEDISDLRAQIFIKPGQDELRRIYSSATVFVSSSWYEGFGLPGLEAMACGVPVVTTDSGGVREYAVNEENCLMVPPKNPQALADAITRLLSDEPLRKKFIKNGLETAKKFDWDRSIDILEEIFQR